MAIEVLFGDMLEILPTLEENSFDSVVTDPPYHLTSIVKRFSKGEPEHTKTYKDIEERSTPIARLARGFMGKSWDGGDIAFQINTWEQVIRVLKPGGYLLCFGGTRTSHRMACAIEDAGFEIRDTLMWLYGTGFPKSLNISKQIDKKQGAEREILGIAGKSKKGGGNICTTGMSGGEYYNTVPATEDAKKWEGYGTALKPAYEPIIMARKPIEEKTVADQVLATGTGAINIDACRITTTDDLGTQQASRGNNRIFGKLDYNKGDTWHQHIDGRWPANVIHDGSADVLEEFKKYGDGNAARFFYSAKANKNDRNGSKHPTVKPVSLMQYLVRLVTPLEGKVLDPFAGSGTTGVACKEEGFHCTMIEKEEEYVYDIYKRFEENNLNCT